MWRGKEMVNVRDAVDDEWAGKAADEEEDSDLPADSRSKESKVRVPKVEGVMGSLNGWTEELRPVKGIVISSSGLVAQLACRALLHHCNIAHSPAL